MMMRKVHKYKITLLTLLFAVVYCSDTYAQYFVSPTDPFNLKWLQLKDSKKGAIIFPDYILEKAIKISFYRDSIESSVDKNMPTKLKKFPISLHPTNILSNGMVTYTPSRMELYTMPSRNNYSLPWIKQLVAHEYRHVAQLSNLDVGMTKVLSYVLGEQILGLSAILLPAYLYEGDATAAETEYAMYGRAKQPEFHILSRAMVNEDKHIKPIQMRLGSINRMLPNSYEMGYFATRYATQMYGDDLWSKVLRFAGRNPYLIDPGYFAYRKYANGTTGAKIIKDAYGEMKKFWHEASQVNNSANIIDTKIKSYTTYNYPFFLDQNLVFAHKTDLDSYSSFVTVDVNTQKETVIKSSGYLTSAPVLNGDYMYWCELKPSLSWGQKNSSTIYSAKIVKNNSEVKLKNFREHKVVGDVFFLTTLGENRFAMVVYNKYNKPSIVVTDRDFNTLKTHAIDLDDISFNGLAWDSVTQRLYAALVCDQGTLLVALDLETDNVTNVKPASYGTITDLSAQEGKLLFTSIDSGKEELHMFDLQNNKEYQLTVSKYGSKSSGTTNFLSKNRDALVLKTYTRDGYMLSLQKIEDIDKKEVEYRLLPSDLTNYPFKSWNLPKLDTINYVETSDYAKQVEVKKYNKASNAINIHSWMPFYLNVDKLANDRELNIGLGVNIISQNLLNSVISSIGYGRVDGMYNLLEAGVTYTGLPVNFDVKLSYGGGQQMVIDGNIGYFNPNSNYFNVNTSAVLPFNLSKRGISRFLNFGVEYDYNNTILRYDRAIGGQSEPDNFEQTGMSKMSYYIYYRNSSRLARKSLAPKFGYEFQLGGALNPFNKDFSNVYYIYSRGFLPGPFTNGAISIAGAFQSQPLKRFWYQQAILFPKGVERNFYMNNYWSSSVDYQVPLVYPNGGLSAVVHIQRISAKVFGDFARAKLPFNGGYRMKNFSSYGLDMIFSTNLLGINQPFDIVFSVYKPSDMNNFKFGVGFNINI